MKPTIDKYFKTYIWTRNDTEVANAIINDAEALKRIDDIVRLASINSMPENQKIGIAYNYFKNDVDFFERMSKAS